MLVVARSGCSTGYECSFTLTSAEAIASLLEPGLDRLQRLHEFPVELGELYLNLSVSLNQDLPAPEEACQVNDEELRALGILCRTRTSCI